MIRALLQRAGIIPAQPDPLDRIKTMRFEAALYRSNRPAPFWK